MIMMTSDQMTMINSIPPTDYVTKRLNASSQGGGVEETPCALERDYYGCYCLKFIVKNGTHITEDKVVEDFGQYGDVVDVRGPGLFSGLRGNHVYVRFIDRVDAESALQQLHGKYHQLTPASISDVLPDNYGLYTISFYNKTGIPSSEVRREFSRFGEVKNLTGSLDVKGGRVFVSYKNKDSAVQALQAFFFRKDRYPNMKFALPRCEKDYFGCYCLKFYNKTGDVTEEKVLGDFGQYGEVVDVRGPGLFDVTGDDVYVRYKEKSSAEQALIELVGRYDSLCLAPPSDIQADKFGYYTITFVNDKCLSKSDVWYIFSKFGTVACVNGTFDCKKGRVFVSYKEKQGALNALETMLITKEYHLQVSKNSTVRKNDYNIVTNNKEVDAVDFAGETPRHERALSEQKRERSSSREASVGPQNHLMSGPPPNHAHAVPRPPPPGQQTNNDCQQQESQNGPINHHLGNSRTPINGVVAVPVPTGKNGLIKFNRNVEKDIFGYYCLSFLNEDGEISEKKVRHDFSKFGEVVSVRGALGKQKGHVFVRFRKKEAAENCLNCLNSFPLSEMSELFGRYLFLSPATPRDIDCDMYSLYSISFLNLNMKTFREIRAEFAKFGDIVRMTSGGGGNTDELVSISYAEKPAAVRALQTHFTNKDYPYLDIAKGSSLLLVNSSDSSDAEDHEADLLHHHTQELLANYQAAQHNSRPHSSERHGHHDPFHTPDKNKNAAGSDVVDELLKPLQSYFSVFRTGQYSHGHGLLDGEMMMNGGPPAHNTRSHDKRYRIKKQQQAESKKRHEEGCRENGLPPSHGAPPPGHNGPPQSQQGHNGPPPGHNAPPQGHNGPPPSHSAPPPAQGHNGPPHGAHPPNHAPPQTNGGYAPPSGPPPRIEVMDNNEISHQHPPPNMTEPPPALVPPPMMAHPPPPMMPPPNMVPHHILMPPPGAVMVPPPQVMQVMSPVLSPSHYHAEERRNSQAELEADLSNMSIHEQDTNNMSNIQNTEGDSEMDLSHQANTQHPNYYTQITKDLFNLFTLSFLCKSKDLSERRVKLDFGQVTEVSRVRGQLGRVDGVVYVSFASREEAAQVLVNQTLLSKYPSLAPAPPVNVVPDRDGYYSIEFVNTGMSGVREITNEFSRHGEIVKVQQGGAKNAVKRVTVSYADLGAAVAAVNAYANNKDVKGIDFVLECLCVAS